MSTPDTAIMQGSTAYDHCLITSCIKKLFTPAAKTTADPGYTITRHVAGLKEELALLNNTSIPELSYAYLSAMEKSVPGAKYRYVVIQKHNTPVLFAWFQLFTITSQNFNLKDNKGFVKGIFRFFLDLKKARVLVAGNALRNETSCCCFDHAALSREEAAQLVTSAAEKIAADEKAAAVILKDMPLNAHIRKWLSGMGYGVPFEDKVMVMDIDPKWESLQGYVGALSRKYKTRANKILASRNNLTVAALDEEQVLHYQSQMHRLFNSVADRQGFVLTGVAADHFTRLKKLYGNDFEVTAFFLDRKLVAFYTAFVTTSSYELYYVGFDYDQNSEHQLYFNILFSGLERAILLQKKQLKLGRTSFDAKASIGATPADINYFIKTPGIPGVAAKWFVNYFSAMEDMKWKLRNPLKTAGS